MKNYTYVALNNGFYFFGEEVPTQDGFMKLVNAAMFGGFSGGKGMPGVVRQDSSAKVTLDRFGNNDTLEFPISSVVFIVKTDKTPYEWKNATLR